MALGEVLHSPSHHADRRWNILLGLSLAVLFGLTAFAVVAVPATLRNDRTASAIQRGNEKQDCRSIFRARLDTTNAELSVARARLEAVENAGLEASGRRDPSALAPLLEQFEPARLAVEQLADATEEEARRYERLAELSKSDPDEFIAMCRNET